MKIFIFLLLIACSCSVVKKAERTAIKTQNPELLEMLENYWITVENPENNQPGEQDSIKKAIKFYLKQK